mmetsp:Transcript_32212/g.57752  ORF Transcript_32212/g.57752 Transcript_32212/m.57752 type:complete len:911 (-) Transcript_32212:95-2827(-)
MVKKALCVGINYPNQQYQLFGCVNDCLDWERVLKETFEFEETRVLIDQNPDGSMITAETQVPNKANILAQLGGWLCAGVQPGDVLVFVFAGHGCQVRTGYGQVDEALVPEDYLSRDASGNQNLVMDDEVQALFARLPAGCMLTVILDCCSSSHMLDVPTSLDSSVQPPRTLQSIERPREAPNRTPAGWQEAAIPHAQARPRFIPTMDLQAQRQKRTPEGAGSHVGRMTLDPGVTAFCIAASRTAEVANDANIKAHQGGVMSFCLFQALSELRHRCTYEQLLQKASSKLEDIRTKYMPTMDQTIQLSFCPNSPPSEVVVMDPRYATVAQHRLSQMSELEQRGTSYEGMLQQGGAQPPAMREVSTEFVPSPIYGQAQGSSSSVTPQANGHSPSRNFAANGGGVSPVGPAGILYVIIHGAYDLHAGHMDTPDPYVTMRVGEKEHSTPVVNNNPNPVWSDKNKFTFRVRETDGVLSLQVVNSNMMKDDVMGRVSINFRSYPSVQWHREKSRLEGGQGELEFDFRLEPEQGSPTSNPPADRSHQPPQTQLPQAAVQRPPSPSTRGASGGHLQQELAYDSRGAAGASHGLQEARRDVQQYDAPSATGGENIFGAPNLFMQMPDLMSKLMGAAQAATPSVDLQQLGGGGMQASAAQYGQPEASRGVATPGPAARQQAPITPMMSSRATASYVPPAQVPPSMAPGFGTTSAAFLQPPVSRGVSVQQGAPSLMQMGSHGYDAFDANGDGFVSQQEYMAAMASQRAVPVAHVAPARAPQAHTMAYSSPAAAYAVAQPVGAYAAQFGSATPAYASQPQAQYYGAPSAIPAYAAAPAANPTYGAYAAATPMYAAAATPAYAQPVYGVASPTPAYAAAPAAQPMYGVPSYTPAYTATPSYTPPSHAGVYSQTTSTPSYQPMYR